MTTARELSRPKAAPTSAHFSLNLHCMQQAKLRVSLSGPIENWTVLETDARGERVWCGSIGDPRTENPRSGGALASFPPVQYRALRPSSVWYPSGAVTSQMSFCAAALGWYPRTATPSPSRRSWSRADQRRARTKHAPIAVIGPREKRGAHWRAERAEKKNETRRLRRRTQAQNRIQLEIMPVDILIALPRRPEKSDTTNSR
ncbi:unnamed protein product, partial [Iphiclides podalirius]